jgi:hypothetical protein
VSKASPFSEWASVPPTGEGAGRNTRGACAPQDANCIVTLSDRRPAQVSLLSRPFSPFPFLPLAQAGWKHCPTFFLVNRIFIFDLPEFSA